MVGGGYVVGHAEYAEHARCQLFDSPCRGTDEGEQATGLGCRASANWHYGLVILSIRLSAKFA